MNTAALTRFIGTALVVLLSGVTALGQERAVANLRDLPTRQQVTNVSFCRGEYDVSIGDGSARRLKEYSGLGDRAFVVFADLEELTVKAACRD